MNHLPLRQIVRSRILSRALRIVPFFLPLLHFRPPTPSLVDMWSYVFCFGVVLAWIASRRRQLAINYRMAPLLRPVTRSERLAGVMPYALAAPAQEFLHRGVLLTSLAPLIGVWAVVATTASFVAEHVLVRNFRKNVTLRDLAVWTSLSVCFGYAVYQQPAALWLAVLAHSLLNTPHVAIWMRRSALSAGKGAVVHA
jgi:membrane protease YdiL (CAAX protease family)